jgi:hypothetical protein
MRLCLYQGLCKNTATPQKDGLDGLGHITVDTCGNLQFHIFLLASLISKDLREDSFILPHEISFMEAFIFSRL